MLHVIRNIYYVQDRADVSKAAKHLAGITRGTVGLFFLIDDEPAYPAFVVLHLDKKHLTVDVVGYLHTFDLSDLHNAEFSGEST
jgi:hypothetical protein